MSSPQVRPLPRPHPEHRPAGLWKASVFPQPLENAPRFPQSDAHYDYENPQFKGLISYRGTLTTTA